MVPYIAGAPTIYSSNLDVLRQVLSGDSKVVWQKPLGTIKPLAKWGRNLVASEDGDVWRRHRRVVGPAFNNKLYEMVWSETLNTYHQIEVAEGWTIKNTVVIPAVQVISTKLALLVIAKCGFGFSFDWLAPPTGPDGKMSIQEAFRVLADSHVVSFVAPDWVGHFPLPGFARVREAKNAFTGFMAREVAARKEEVRSESEDAEERSDTFTMLVRANERETGKWRLDDQELVGNVFIMLFAGHETTARALSAALALLALHQEIQNEVADQIISVVGYDRDPVYDDFNTLNKVLATFYETLRLFPPAYLLSRDAVEDTVLHLPNPLGQEGTTPLLVHEGTNIILDVIGIQYNPRYFPDPEAFKPSRWYNTSSDSESFSAFSLGQRACIGRKFATVEGVAFLTMLLRNWRVEPVCNTGETLDMWRERVLSQPDLGITLGVRDAPVRLLRRKHHTKL
ncbi:hypothetical protein C0991_000811 [Blastosporella zonata]|nr:hypothetical protein C0991_000811 [Blastosporella zonata]